MKLDTCALALGDNWQGLHTIAYYSHLVPITIALLLGFFVLIKSKFSLLSNIFFLFILGFCLWLLGDVVTWTAPNFHLITAFWAPLDYINILFYLLAAYFFSVLIRGKDIENWQKVLLLLLSLPAWWITISGQSIVGFYQPYCEATNNDWLTQYKLVVEMLVLAFIMFSAMFAFFKADRARRGQITLVSTALVLFLAIFASTEYIASMTGIYEINLYSLFVLPVFLAMIIFSITNLKIFAFRTFGTQLLIYILLIMVGSQFFLLQDATYRALTLVTFVLSLFLGFVLVRNINREERLALALEEANEGQAQLIHFINHQIKGYLSKARIIFSELLSEPEYASIPESAREMVGEGEASLKEGVDFVQQILKASDIDKGTFTYDMKTFDMKELVQNVNEEMSKLAEGKGLKYEVTLPDGDYNMVGDRSQLREAVKNLIDNSIRYTPSGSVRVRLVREDSKILFTVTDTGVGLSDELKPRLFTKGGRSKDSIKINVNSTGYGLSIVKGIVTAHQGRVWVESLGPGQGSTFYMELPVNS